MEGQTNVTSLMASGAVRSTLDAVRSPARFILEACEEAKAQLGTWVSTGQLEPLILMHKHAGLVRAHAIQLRTGKPYELAAQEIVRRCERAICMAVPAARQNGSLVTSAGQGPGKTWAEHGIHKDVVAEFRALSHCTEAEFEKALSEAAAEGSLARVAVLRKLTGIPARERPPRGHSAPPAAEKQRRAVNTAAVQLSGITHGLAQITELHPHIDAEEASRWAASLSDSRRVIEQLIKRCKERSNA